MCFCVKSEWKNNEEPDAYITGNLDPGLLVIEGKLRPEVVFSEAESAIEEEIDSIKTQVKEYELDMSDSRRKQTDIPLTYPENYASVLYDYLLLVKYH